MSLLSNTAGTPQRVHALLKMLAAADEPFARAAVEAYMTAGVESGSQDQGKTPFIQTLGAARDLKLVEERDGLLALAGHGCPADHRSFADLIHARLIADDVDPGDAVVLDTFAYVAHRTDDGPTAGPHWFMDANRENLADEFRVFIDRTRGSTGKGTFNPTRFAPWQKWTELLGLTVALDRDKPFPEIASRVAREIASDHHLPVEEEIRARDFLDRILARMPYLPGGRRSVELLGPPPKDGVPGLLAAALRDLEADGVIKLRSLGDSGNAMVLPGDGTRPTRSFNSVLICERGPAT